MTMTMTRPVVSSPLAGSSHANVPSATRMAAKRNPSFPSSRPLRPFPTIAHIMQPKSALQIQAAKSKSAKLIEPPKNFKATFTLDLTQAELSRQDDL